MIHGVDVGNTVLLNDRTKTTGCTLAANPDRQCSPGAYYSKLTKKRICADDFRTSKIRNVPQPEKDAVKVEYGLSRSATATRSRSTTSSPSSSVAQNDMGKLFPEKADAHPGYHVKDKLENKLHDLVCDGKRTLSSVRRRIASNWQLLYKSVYGVEPSG